MRRPPFHVVLLPTFAMVFLLAMNRDEVRPSDALPALAVGVAGCLLAWNALVRPLGETAGLAVTIPATFFFSYGHVRALVAAFAPKPLFASHRVLVPAWTVVAGVIAALVVHRVRSPREADRALSVAFAVMLVVPIAQVAVDIAARPPLASVVGDPNEGDPDIFYIVLDGYANPWTLKTHYGYDDAWFVENLTSRGFQVVRESRSNYGFTTLSMASALNMRYVNELPEMLGETSQDGQEPLELIRTNAVERFLRERGYRTVHITTGFEPPGPRLADSTLDCGRFSAFDELALQSTALGFVMNHFTADRRDRILCAFDAVAEVERVDERPVFVYAHFLTPHAPYLFAADGAPIEADFGERPFGGARFAEERALYVGQLNHTNTLTLRALDRILARAGPDDIIIVQSDHGAGLSAPWDDLSEGIIRDRMRNFEAIRASGLTVYPGMTPVNIFREIFRSEFGSDLPRLPDESFFSELEFPYRLHNVTAVASTGWD